MKLLGRRGRVVVGVVVTLVVIGGALAWYLSRFPARTEAIPGTPFVLEVQSGVPASDLVGIKAGLTAMDSYLNSELGVAVTERVRVRVSWSQGCRPLLGPKSGPTAWVNGVDFVCLNPGQSRWVERTRGHAYYPAYVAAHEHVHNLQAQLGCFPDVSEHEWQWLFEGMATELAFRALIKANLVSAADAELSIWEYRGLQSDNGTLTDYERSSDAAGDAYGLFQLGARTAADVAGAPKAFATFCRAVAGKAPWRAAFRDAFGISVPDLYQRVEQERARLRPTYADRTG